MIIQAEGRAGPGLRTRVMTLKSAILTAVYCLPGTCLSHFLWFPEDQKTARMIIPGAVQMNLRILI